MAMAETVSRNNVRISFLLLGSSKGEVSREECIEKIAASINYVHSQTSDVITGTEIAVDKPSFTAFSCTDSLVLLSLLHCF